MSSPPRPILPPGVRRRLAPFAGPVLITAAVLTVMHGFWLHPKLTNQHVDLLAQWLPWYCHMGKSLVHGTIPTWQTFQFAGAPFASDPQKGWLYAPVIVLYGSFGCARALGLFMTLQPILAGLGLYWFFRHEGLGRAASTVGGLTLAMIMSNSHIAISLPFSGTIAWTGVALAAASGYLHGKGTLSTVGWLALIGFAVSQVAAAQLTDGLLVTAIVLTLYMLARLIRQVRDGRRSWAQATLTFVLPFVVAPLLAAAILLPPLSLLPRTPIGHGYQDMARIASELSGVRIRTALGSGVGPWWGTSFARGPAGYAGALGILLIPFALASRRWRWPAAAFAVAGFAGWLLNIDTLIRSRTVRNAALRTPLGELWLHSPIRLRYLVVIAVAALAGYGFQSWLDMGTARDRAAIAARLLPMAAVILVFVAAPIMSGSSASTYAFFGIGAVYSMVLLTRIARGDRWAVAALPFLLAVELVAAGLIQQLGPGRVSSSIEQEGGNGLGTSFTRYHAPFIDPATYLRPGPIGNTLIAARDDYGRYLSFNPPVSLLVRGFLTKQSSPFWPAYENGRSILFGIDEVQGYSPVQLDRYWRLVRRVSRRPIYYNAATFQSIDPQVLELLGVEWLILPQGTAPPDVALPTPVASEGGWRLYRLARPEPRASVVFSAQVLPSAGALEAVLRPEFDPAQHAVVEEAGPALPPTGGVGQGSAHYVELSSQHVRVTVTASARALLVVRNVIDRNWHASVDGRPVPVYTTDYLLQGVPVPAGRHEVDLTYRDPAIGQGLAISGGAWGALGIVAGWLWFRKRRSRPRENRRDPVTASADAEMNDSSSSGQVPPRQRP